MKYSIILFVIMSLALIAQEKKTNESMADKTQVEEWMNKISSDSEMSNTMISRILEKYTGDEAEMTKLGVTIMANHEMSSVITDLVQKKTDKYNISVEPRGMSDDSSKTKGMKLIQYK